MQLVVNTGKAKGKSINVTGSRYLIGRSRECQMRPQSEEVSQRHAELKIISGIVVLVDLGSESGTQVNGQRLTGPASLRNGDRIGIGPLSLTVLLEEKNAKKPPRRSLDDQVALWVTEDDKEAGTEISPRRTRRSTQAANALAGGKDGPSAT